MANEQTSVPLFVADTILTAAQQNISAGTGVPVFATTVTRDAAFGGANKALAEGQLCYLSATNVVQYYDGAAWATVGPAAASSGLVCVKAETAFTAATSVTADSVFTSTYTNYLINFKFQGSTTNDALLKLRVGGVSASTAYNYQELAGIASTASAARSTSQTSFVLGTNTNGAFNSYVQVNLSSPQLAEPTLIKNDMAINNATYAQPITRHYYGNHSTATAYDGVEFLCATGTITGSYTIYGYSETV